MKQFFFHIILRKILKFITLILRYRWRFVFVLESRIFAYFNKLFDRHPSSFPHVSGDTYRSFAHYYFERECNNLTADFEDQALIFCSLDALEAFFEKIKQCDKSFSLITHHSDRSVDRTLLNYIEDRRVIKWFAQNLMIKHPKCVAIPIGLEDLWRHNAGLIAHVKRKNPTDRKPIILYGFSVGTNPTERKKALSAVANHPCSLHVDLPARSYFKVLLGSMFVLSPPGNGVDCHRTWEAILAGCIPIVKRSMLYDGFSEFPGLIIDDWCDLGDYSEVDLINIFNEKSKYLHDCRLLEYHYWARKIEGRNDDIV
jgi:hypothetical protein